MYQWPCLEELKNIPVCGPASWPSCSPSRSVCLTPAIWLVESFGWWDWTNKTCQIVGHVLKTHNARITVLGVDRFIVGDGDEGRTDHVPIWGEIGSQASICGKVSLPPSCRTSAWKWGRLTSVEASSKRHASSAAVIVQQSVGILKE